MQALPEVLADRVELLQDILRKSRAVSTCSIYEYAFMRWRNWALSNQLGTGDILPVKAFQVFSDYHTKR
ncbi:hypothetical protein DPMN_008266 [Dreissena polymorpha]|uniref:Uncharacterized protein n=1 Tax=Dreissena polymorpha TaxID=45954 RepID=A0A9D4MUT9_DREPO|nr:hypothetical protein DPMN_008266 [Dreissena polymorpha]